MSFCRNGRAYCRSRPLDAISNHPDNLFVVISRVSFMTGAEVENFATSACPCSAATKNLASLKPTDKDLRVGCRDVEWFAVHLFFRKFDIVTNPINNRMPRLSYPQALGLFRLAPFQVTSRTH